MSVHSGWCGKESCFELWPGHTQECIASGKPDDTRDVHSCGPGCWRCKEFLTEKALELATKALAMARDHTSAAVWIGQPSLSETRKAIDEALAAIKKARGK